MQRTTDSDGFLWAERFAYILLAVLLFTWAFVSEIEIDLRSIGLGYVDPFFTLGVMWIGIIFIMKGTIAVLQRKSYRGLGDIWKGPLTDIKTNKSIGHSIFDGGLAINQLAIFPTGGTSKPCVRGFSGTRFIVFPIFYSVVFGGYVIIMSKLHSYPKKTHGDLLTHITTTMKKQKGFVFDYTKIIVGEHLDPKWAVKTDNGWVIEDAPSGSLNMVEEASICRMQYDMIEEAYRAREQLKIYGYIPADGD